jgi:protocatechuate 3,4-dioxygenase, alpha subunit
MTAPTGSQTVGPFFHLGVSFLTRDQLVAQGIAGEIVSIRGKVLDGDGNPIPDAMLEFWQADSAGNFAAEFAPETPAAPRFRGFGRVESDQWGAFAFTTIKPGRVPFPGGSPQAPHIAVTVFARGLLKHLWTRIYFPGDPANDSDPVLNLVPRDRQATLIARSSSDKSATPEGASGKLFDWNVVLQGDGETVFFDY